MVGDDAFYLILQTHDFLHCPESILVSMTGFFPMYLTTNILKSHHFIVLLNDTGPRNRTGPEGVPYC